MYFLLDTDATTSCINKNIFNTEEYLENPIEVMTAGGIIDIKEKATAPFNKTWRRFYWTNW